MSSNNLRDSEPPPPHPVEATGDATLSFREPAQPSPSDLENLLQFCPRSNFTNELQTRFVETVRDCLRRCASALTGSNFVAALQEDFTPELFVHPEVCAKPNIYTKLTEKFEKLGIPVPEFVPGEKKSRALRLARIVWHSSEYQHERNVAEYIVYNRITPDPHRPITLSMSPNGEPILPHSTPPAHITHIPAQQVNTTGLATSWTATLNRNSEHQTPQQVEREQVLHRITFEEENPRQPRNPTEQPYTSRLRRNTTDYRLLPSEGHPTHHINAAITNNANTPAPPFGHATPSVYNSHGYHSQDNNRTNNYPLQASNGTDSKGSYDRSNKLATAFSTAYKDASSRYNGTIDDSWPEKRQLFEDIAQNYKCTKSEALEYLNNLFTGGARLTYRKCIKNKVHDYDEAMRILDSEFHGETAQERILAKLESLRFETFVAPGTSLNDTFVKLTNELEDLFPRAPPHFQDDYHKRRILSTAVEKQPWALTTLDRTTEELPTYSALTRALARVLQKHVARGPTETTLESAPNTAFYTNPRFGQHNPPNYHRTGRSSHRRQNGGKMNCYRCGSPDHIIRNCPMKPRTNEPRRLYRVRRHFNQSRTGRHNAFYVLEDDLELLDLDETDDVLDTPHVTDAIPVPDSTPDADEMPVTPDVPSNPSAFFMKIAEDSANFHAALGQPDFSDTPF
ncbi:hypothetical protein FGB62_71g229 [Gracilaria domingensis]|nr:hypothetical protein FGB62_71g229 [Gracilaria domingensis]